MSESTCGSETCLRNCGPCLQRISLLEATSAAHEARLNEHDAGLRGLAARLEAMEAAAQERDRRQTNILERILEELLAVRAAVKRD